MTDVNDKKNNIWYANCICLADILDSDHDLSRRPGDENPLEIYWKKYFLETLKDDHELKIIYKQIFEKNQQKRTQHNIQKMFVELIDKLGPKFEDIDGPGQVPRIALSVRNFVCNKKIADQRKFIDDDSHLTKVVVETHRGGNYDQNNKKPAELYKYNPSTIFDNPSNAEFLPFDYLPPKFSNNYFPDSTTRMTTKKQMLEGISDKERSFLSSIQSTWEDSQKLLVHTFRGFEGNPTYSVQWGQVTADEVTYELFKENRRSWCSTIKTVQKMIISISIDESTLVHEDDILARNCHIIYGKTCGDGVSIDAAELIENVEKIKCGVLSNDICCCYRAAIVNGYGYRACPTSNMFSTTRNMEVFQTKPKGEFDIEKARINVTKLLKNLKNIEADKKTLIGYINTFFIQPQYDKDINHARNLYNKKKEFLIQLIKRKKIPEDLKPFMNGEDVPVITDNLLKRYCYYDIDQCIGSKEFYKIELDQFIVDIKSNIDQLKKIRITVRSKNNNKNDIFGDSLSIIANIELVLSSFIMEKYDETVTEMVPDKKLILKYSKLFFKSNLVYHNGSRFLTKFKEALQKTAQKGTQQVKDLLKYLTNVEEGTDSQSGGEGEGEEIILLMSILVPMPYSYEEVDDEVELLQPWNSDNNNTDDIIQMFDLIIESDFIIRGPSTPLSHIASVSQAPTLFFNYRQNNIRKQYVADLFDRPHVSKPKGRSNTNRSTKKMHSKTRRSNKKQGESIINQGKSSRKRKRSYESIINQGESIINQGSFWIRGVEAIF